MKKLFIILGALLFTTMIYLFISNIIIPSVITEGTIIGIHGEKLSGAKVTEVIQFTKKVTLLSCIIFLTTALRMLTGSQVSENED